MKIVNTKSGEAYELSPNMELEIERTNLFFNDYGEQSLPVTLPDTPRNRRLLGHPADIANTHRPSDNIECKIEDGDFYAIGRQVVLSATVDGGIETSFYLNEGSFLAKVGDTSLYEVFGEECIEGVNTVAEAVTFCKSLWDGSHPGFGCFEIYVDDDPYTVNESDFVQHTSHLMSLNQKLENGTFYHEVSRTIERDGKQEQMPAGAYITPFVKVNYLLRRVFAHFGYTLQPHFFSQTAPFDRMVLLNNTCDAIVKGKIRIIDLLPDITCDELLEVLRKKFLCEFIPNEVEKTVSIVVFRDLLNSPVQADITRYMVDAYAMEFPEERQRVVLTGTPAETHIEVPRLKGVADLKVKAPASYVKEDGSYQQQHLIYKQWDTPTGMIDWAKPDAYKTEIVVAASSMPYDSGEKIESVEVNIGETLPEYRDKENGKLAEDIDLFRLGGLCVGRSRWVNTVVVKAGQTVDDALKEKKGATDGDDVGVAFAFQPDLASGGFVKSELYADGYALGYNGPYGIYEKFHRGMDDLRRNSLCTVTVELLLPPYLIKQLDVHGIVSLCGQRMLINQMTYRLGSGRKTVTCKLLTTRSYEPISVADSNNMNVSTEYEWVPECSAVTITKQEYESSVDKDLGEVMVAIDRYPTKELFDSQELFYHRTWAVKPYGTANEYKRVNYGARVKKKTVL